jgi:hypothetical protein
VLALLIGGAEALDVIAPPATSIEPAGASAFMGVSPPGATGVNANGQQINNVAVYDKQ